MKGGFQERAVYRNKEQYNLSKVTTTAKTGRRHPESMSIREKNVIEKNYLTAMT